MANKDELLSQARDRNLQVDDNSTKAEIKAALDQDKANADAGSQSSNDGSSGAGTAEANKSEDAQRAALGEGPDVQTSEEDYDAVHHFVGAGPVNLDPDLPKVGEEADKANDAARKEAAKLDK